MRIQTPPPTDPTAPKHTWPRQWVSYGFDPPKGWGGSAVLKVTVSAPGGWIHEAAWWRRRDASTAVGISNQPHERVGTTIPGGPEQFQGMQRELTIPDRCDELELLISAPGGAHFATYYER